ncbi:unnamed protein product [Caretta caretta]
MDLKVQQVARHGLSDPSTLDRRLRENRVATPACQVAKWLKYTPSPHSSRHLSSAAGSVWVSCRKTTEYPPSRRLMQLNFSTEECTLRGGGQRTAAEVWIEDSHLSNITTGILRISFNVNNIRRPGTQEIWATKVPNCRQCQLEVTPG